MRPSTVMVIAASVISLVACVGEVGDSRKPGRDPGATPDGPCDKLTKDVVVRSASDMAGLPRAGCYDIYGKLTVQGTAVTSLAGLNGINSVNALELNNTGLTAIDTRRPLGIFDGALVVTGNAKLTNLKQLSFETDPAGVVIDDNPALVTLDPLSLDDPKLDQVNGDVAITGNAGLAAVALGNLVTVKGALTIARNPAVKTIDLTRLAATSHVEIAENTQLATISSLGATTINGDLAISSNPALSSLGMMANLYRVTGNLTIDNNTALTSLAAFTTSMKFVDHGLTIINNQALADLGSLKHLQLVGAAGGQITITNNTSLMSCRANEIDRCVGHTTSSVIGNNKDSNCNSQCN